MKLDPYGQMCIHGTMHTPFDDDDDEMMMMMIIIIIIIMGKTSAQVPGEGG